MDQIEDLKKQLEFAKKGSEFWAKQCKQAEKERDEIKELHYSMLKDHISKKDFDATCAMFVRASILGVLFAVFLTIFIFTMDRPFDIFLVLVGLVISAWTYFIYFLMRNALNEYYIPRPRRTFWILLFLIICLFILAIFLRTLNF